MELNQRIKQRLREVEDWTAVIDEFETEVASAQSEEAQSRGFFQLARACEDIFLDKARAMQCYQKAFKVDQTNLDALRRAREIYQEMAHLEMVTRLMGLELKKNQDPKRATELNYAYGRAMLNLRQIDTAKQFLEAAVTGDPDRVEYQRRFAETQYDRENWQADLDGLLQQLAATTGEDDPLAAKVPNAGAELSHLYLRAARILQQEEPGDERLLPLLFKALEADPHDDEAGFLAEIALAEVGQPAHIQRLQDRRAQLVDDPQEKLTLLRHFGSVWQVRLNDPERAAYFYRQALDLAYNHALDLGSKGAPASWHLAAFRTLKEQAQLGGEADGLIPLAERGLSVIADETDAAIVALQAGEIAWHQFNDVDTAKKFFDRAGPLAPEHPVIRAFQNEVGGLDLPKAAKGKSKKKAAAAPSAEEPPVSAGPPVEIGDEEFTAEEMGHIEAARAAEDKGGKRAIDGWRDAVNRMPHKHYPRERLKQLYVEGKRWSNVADLIKDELKHTPDEAVDRTEELHWELVSLYRDQLRQPGLVVTTLSTLEKLMEDRGDSSRLLRVVESQQEQFEAMKRWPDLIGRIRRRAELTEDPLRCTELHLQAGHLFLEKFNNQAEAIKSFESVLEIDEYNADAIDKLKELYGRRRDWEKMIAVQQKELQLIEDPAERKAQLLEVARTAGTKIKKPSLSIALWTQVLEVDPENAEALEHLEQMQERDKDWPALATTLERLAEITTDLAKRQQVLVKLGLLYSEKLNDNQAAIRTWETLYEAEPDNRRAQDALKKLYLAQGDMNALEAFYAQQEKWAEFIRVLEREADSAEPDAKLTLLLKIADLYHDKLGKPDRAIRALEKALSDDEENLTVAERLIGLYRQAGDERHLSRPLAIKLDHTDDSTERQELLRQLAELAERVQNDKNLAFSYYRRAFDEDHTSVEVREALERLGEETRMWNELVQALEVAITRFSTDTASLPLRLKAAFIYEQHAHDFESALRTNQAILEIAPEEATALASLERLYLSLGQEQDLLNVLNTKLSLASTEEDKHAILARIGSIQEQLGNHDQAIEAYESVLNGGGDSREVLSALDRLYSQSGRAVELADILRRELDAADPSARSELLLRLAILQQDRLESPRDAIELFRQVLELEPDNREARARLEGWLADPDLNVDVAAILLPAYERSEAWPELVKCLEIQAAADPNPDRRVELLLRTGAILSQALGNSTAAFDAYAKAFEEDPHNEVAQQALEQIAMLEDRWTDFAALYEDAAAKDLPGELLNVLLSRLAILYDSQLQDTDKAIACYQRAADIDPTNRTALDALETLYHREERWSDLLEVFRRKVDVESDPELRQRYRFQIARLQEELLDQRQGAIQTYNEILADDDINADAVAALDRLYVATESWSDLADNLGRQLTLMDDVDRQIQLSLRLGEVQLNRLEQPGLAVETYSRVLDLDGNNSLALRALEGVLSNPDHQMAVARILEPVYRTSNNWSKLIEVHEIMVQHSLDPAEKIRLLHQIGELYEIAGEEPQRAFVAFGRALKEEPANENTQARLEHLARQMGSFAELVGLYEEVAADVVDDQLRIHLLTKVAQVDENALADTDKAAATYEKILDVDPGNLEAIDALIEVHRRTNNFDALVKAVVRKSEMVESADDRKQLLLYAANVRETVMDDPEQAIDLYQQVLTIDDGDATSLEALERLFIQLERWDQLKDVYQRKTEVIEDPEERRKILYVLGQVYDVELKDVDRAIDTYQAILDIDPADYQAITALDRLYGQAERWLDQLQTLERAIEVADRGEEQTAIRYRVGALWETHLNDPVRAIESYREVLRQDPNHQPTIEALNRIVHGETEPMAAAQVLAPLYEQLAEWEKLVDIYEVIVANLEDPLAKIERLHEVASIYERHLNEYDKAFDAYARAVAVDAQHGDTLVQLDRLADVTGDWEKFADLLSLQADRILDPLVKVEMLLRLARIYEERVGDVDRAISHYLAVLDSEPENAPAIESLDRIFTALERWPELVENLRRRVRITADEPRLVDLYFRMGQVYQYNLGDLPHAIEAYREVLNVDPAHSPTLNSLEMVFAEGEQQSEIAEILEPIYYAAERWDALVKLGEVKLSASEDTTDRLAVIQNVADICERRLGDPGEAYIWWLRAYMDDPLNEQVSIELERLAEMNQEWGHIVDVGEQVLEGNPSPEVRLAVLLRSARVLEEKLREPARAVDIYRKVLEIDPENVPALAALDRIYSSVGAATELAEILQRRIQVTVDSDVLVDLQTRLAASLEQDVGNADQAIEAYNRVLDNDPGHLEALQRLEVLYLSQYRWQDLFDNYQRMVDVSNTDDDMAGCYQRMAKIAADTLDRETDAVDLWNRVLDLRGEDPLALGELARLHERHERWDELVEVLERQVYVLEEPQEKVRAFQVLGHVYGEKLGRERNAMDAWLNAIQLDDRSVETLEALRHIYEHNQAWVELIDVLERLIAIGPEELGHDRLRELYASVGRIQGEFLMQPDMAIEAWHRVLELHPGDMEALAALEDLYTQGARWSEAIQVLERKSNVLEEADARIDVLMQIASIWEEKLDDKNQARGAYHEILEVDPAHHAASEALEQICRETDDWASLAELLISRAEVLGDRDQKVETLQGAAKVFEEELGDQDSAFAVLQAAFNEDYTNDHTARELERLATQANKWADLLNEYNGLVQTLEDDMERCELWVKIGRWYGEHLNRPDYGIQSLEQALQLNPESVSALRELASFHRRAGNAQELADTLARIVPLEHEPAAQAQTLLDLAEVQETSLGNPTAAIECYRRVLEIDSESITALDALARLHEERNDWQELVVVLSRRAATSDDPDAALALKKRVGQVQETSLADTHAAIETYKDIIAQEPTDQEALSALERLYQMNNQLQDYLDVLEAQLDAAVEVEQQVRVYDKMATALIELSNDPERAAEVLEKIIMLDPSQIQAYQKLEELYTSLEKWAELVETYRSHIDATEDPLLKVQLLAAMGGVYERRIEDVDRAIDAYGEILSIDPHHFEAANVLSRLQEAIEDWPAAVSTMGRLAELTDDPAARLDLLTRMGRVLHHKLMDSEQAEQRLNQALEMDQGHVPALVLLADIHKQRNDWLKAARTLEAGSEHSQNNLEKTNLAAEAAFIHFEELENRQEAIGLFARTLVLDPEHVRVGRVLADIYYEAGDYEAADPIFDMLTRKADSLELDDDEQRDLFLRAARVARQRADAEKALKQYKRAYDVDSTDHEVLSGMADLLFEREDWDRSFKLYQTILVQHRDTQSDDDTVRVYHRLGTIKNRQGEPRKALNYFEKALEVQPHHSETLKAVIDLQGQSNDWEGVIQAKRALIEVSDGEEEQFELYKDIGDLYAQKIGNKDKASQSYENALEIRPDDYPLLHSLLELYTEAKRWDDTIRVIDRIVGIEDDPIRRSRYNYTAAVLLRDELNAHDESIDRLNMVLDDDPRMLKAFQAIDTMVTKTRDWKTLERSYRKMLKRLPQDGDDQLKLTLWGNLGEIYRSRMKDYKSASAAFQVAAKLDPGNVQRHIILAELYEQLMQQSPAEYVDNAVHEHQILIANEPFRYESYHALYNIYRNANQEDKAFCVSMVLSFLKKATPEQQAFFDKYRRPDFVMARQRLSEETLRRHVFHPDEDLYMTAMLGLVAPSLAAWRAADLPPSMKVKERVDISTDPALFSRMAKYVKEVVNLPQPDVFLRPDEPGDTTLLNVKRDGGIHPTMVVFQNLLRGKAEKHLSFALGRYMMDLYLPHYAYVVLDRSHQNLKQVVLACLRAVGMPVQGDTAALDQIAREITGRMAGGATDQLRTLIKKFVDAGGSTDVKRWAAARELTNYRVGLLLCGDLVIAAQMISQEQSMLGSAMSPKDKIKELVLYSISEDYFAARRALGLAVA